MNYYVEIHKNGIRTYMYVWSNVIITWIGVSNIKEDN